MQPEPSGKVAKLPTSLRRSQGGCLPACRPLPGPARPPRATHPWQPRGAPQRGPAAAGAGPCSATSLLVLPPGPGSLGLVVTLPAPWGGPRPGEGGGRDGGGGMGRRYSLAPRSPVGERSGWGRFGGVLDGGAQRSGSVPGGVGGVRSRTRPCPAPAGSPRCSALLLRSGKAPDSPQEVGWKRFSEAQLERRGKAARGGGSVSELGQGSRAERGLLPRSSLGDKGSGSRACLLAPAQCSMRQRASVSSLPCN